MATEWRGADVSTVFLRVALGTTFLSAVADRFGIWGAPGTPNVGWGDFSHFIAYTQKLTSMMPPASTPVLAWLATIAEIVFGVGLIIGWQTRIMAFLSGILLLIFALAMFYGRGPEAPFSYSVFVDSAAAFLLACCDRYALSLDESISARREGFKPT
jgi:uncharacterized membrane protein YphA (DoxX/SURF4 family)